MKKWIKLLLVLLFLQCLTATTLLAQAGLIAYYPFNGNAHDETGNGYNGTVSGATLSDDRFGNPMSAYSFDGINDKIVIGKEPNFPSWDTYAVSLWFLNDGGGDQGQGYGQKILSKAQFRTDFHLSVLNDGSQGHLSWWSAQGGFNSVNATNQDYRDNQWHHVVLNKNSPSNGDIWVDGVLQNSSNTLQAVFNREDLVIGFTTHRDGYQQKYWSGKIDDIRIYNGVLSESEISDLFTEGGNCPVPSNLRVTDITSTSAKLKWDSIPAAQGYKVRYKASTDSEWTREKRIGNGQNIDDLLPGTKYKWQVRAYCQVDTPMVMSDWSVSQKFTTSVLRISDASLQQLQQSSFRIYPNPAKDHATIQFTLAQSSHVFIKVYDVSGKEMATLFNGNSAPGSHSVQLNAGHFSKGIYFVRLISDPGIENQKLIVQ